MLNSYLTMAQDLSILNLFDGLPKPLVCFRFFANTFVETTTRFMDFSLFNFVISSPWKNVMF